MPTALNLEPVLRFLDELNQHNDRVWFTEFRPAYDDARKTFEQFVDGIIDPLRETDHLQNLSAKDCIGRFYRDVRFTKDKSPYKTNFAAMITPGGWGASWFGYYISIQPHGQSMVAGGMFNPDPQQLNRFRQEISQDASEFKQLIGAKGFIEAFGAVQGDRLKTAPKGYDRSHAEIELLQLKQVIAMRHFSDVEVLARDFSEQVVGNCHELKPFLEYLTRFS